MVFGVKNGKMAHLSRFYAIFPFQLLFFFNLFLNLILIAKAWMFKEHLFSLQKLHGLFIYLFLFFDKAARLLSKNMKLSVWVDFWPNRSPLAKSRVLLYLQKNRKDHSMYFYFNNYACYFYSFSWKIVFKHALENFPSVSRYLRTV